MSAGTDKGTRQILRGVAAAIALGLPLVLYASGEFSVGTWAIVVDLREAPGADPHEEGGWAVPLKGPVPEWYTPELREQVLAADGSPVAAPMDAPLPSEVGIRPGAWQIDPAGCTMNFVFRKNHALAIGTAGHCVDRIGQPVVGRASVKQAPQTKNPRPFGRGFFRLEPGDDLLSHGGATLSSALSRFTSVFEMGTGGTNSLKSPGKLAGRKSSRDSVPN